MKDPLTQAMEAAAQSYRAEAEKRRAISKTDPVADTLDFVAGDLAVRLREARAAGEELTVEQYAKAEDVTPQTVRTWIRRGVLPARETPKGYRIAKGARRVTPSLRERVSA